MQMYRARTVKQQRNQTGTDRQQLNSAKVTNAGGRQAERHRQGACKKLGLFSIMEARGPAVKCLAHERDAGQVAWSQALFCEVLIKKTHNFSFLICQQ